MLSQENSIQTITKGRPTAMSGTDLQMHNSVRFQLRKSANRIISPKINEKTTHYIK